MFLASPDRGTAGWERVSAPLPREACHLLRHQQPLLQHPAALPRMSCALPGRTQIKVHVLVGVQASLTAVFKGKVKQKQNPKPPNRLDFLSKVTIRYESLLFNFCFTLSDVKQIQQQKAD